MKKILFAFLAFSVIACAQQKSAAAFIDGKHTIESPCPKGECTFEVLKDNSLVINEDNTGKFYYTLSDEPGKVVIRYTYDKITRGTIQDGSYKEIIIFETDSEFSDLSGGNIKDIKILFGVHCFCKRAGFYKIEEGTITYANERLHVTVPGNIVDRQCINAFDVIVSK